MGHWACRSRTTRSSATSTRPRWSAATGRSTGSACPTSTRTPASPGCSGTRPTATGASPRRRRARSPDAPAPLPRGHARARDRVRHRRRAPCASPTACPSARTTPRSSASSRVLTGDGRSCAWSSCVRFGYGHVLPWVTPMRRPAHGARPGPTRSALWTRCRDPRRGHADGRGLHAHARASRSRSSSPGTSPTSCRPRPIDPWYSRRGDGGLVERVVRRRAPTRATTARPCCARSSR